jgi:hypothetical protein
MASERDLVPVSWDGHNINDTTNYKSGFVPGHSWGLPPVQILSSGPLGEWPVVTGVNRPQHRLYLQVRIMSATPRMQRDYLLHWFSPEDETPKKLIIEDANGSYDRYVYAICERIQPLVIDGKASGRGFGITLVVHGDVSWRIDGFSQSWNITASGQTHTFTNPGSDEVYPIIKIKPTGAKTGGYAYKRWLPVKWNVETAATSYPTFVVEEAGFDTASLTPAKMRADGNDLRIWVDGIEDENRWIYAPDTDHTGVWVNLDWAANIPLTLDGALGAGALTTLTLNENIGSLPTSGTVMIDSEAFVYTGKSTFLKQLTGVARAAKGTGAAGHADNTPVYWIQHDIWMVYGLSTAAAPNTDNNYQPMLHLGSRNGSWTYLDFKEDDGLRTGSWTPVVLTREAEITFYGGNHGAVADPWAELGIEFYSTTGLGSRAHWRLYNPCGITNANFTSGEKFADDSLAWWSGYIKSSANGTSWTLEYTIPKPTILDTWQAWSQDEVITAGMTYVALELYAPDEVGVTENYYLECSSVTCTINAASRPSVVVGAEQTNYSLNCTLTNTITNIAITLVFMMTLNEELWIDTYNKTVVYKADNSRQMQALTQEGGARRKWLHLAGAMEAAAGNNMMRYDETGATAVTVAIAYSRRDY